MQVDLYLCVVVLVCDQFGGLDIVVNNVGLVGLVKFLVDLVFEDWDQVLVINLMVGFLGVCVQILVMLWCGLGVIIMILSFVGSSVGLFGMVVYGVVKVGLSGLVKGIVVDYGYLGICVNVLLLGGIDMVMVGDQVQKDWVVGLYVMKCIVVFLEIVMVVLFLVSLMVSFVIGMVFYVDGGNVVVKQFVVLV